jgi:uncharacterized protein with HEPN domain
MKDHHKDSSVRLQHILKAIEHIEQFTTGVSEESFVKDTILSSAVLFQFSVIGEAVTYTDPAILEKYDYPWYKVRAFRNMIAHEYFNIRLSSVWRIILQDLPGLKATVQAIMENSLHL